MSEAESKTFQADREIGEGRPEEIAEMKGNYILDSLRRGSQSALRRFIWLVLCGTGLWFMHAITVHPIVTLVHHEFRQQRRGSIVEIDNRRCAKFKTEFRSMSIRWFKDIVVLNPSPNKSFFAGTDFVHIGGMNINAGFGADKCIFGGFVRWFKSKGTDSFGWHNRFEYGDTQISRRCSSAISDCGNHAPRVWFSIPLPTGWFKSEGFQKNVGPILGSENLGLSLISFPLQACDTCLRNSNHEQQPCEQGNRVSPFARFCISFLLCIGGGVLGIIGYSYIDKGGRFIGVLLLGLGLFLGCFVGPYSLPGDWWN
jgi:hypothetical protein